MSSEEAPNSLLVGELGAKLINSNLYLSSIRCNFHTMIHWILRYCIKLRLKFLEFNSNPLDSHLKNQLLIQIYGTGFYLFQGGWFYGPKLAINLIFFTGFTLRFNFRMDFRLDLRLCLDLSFDSKLTPNRD